MNYLAALIATASALALLVFISWFIELAKERYESPDEN